MTAVGSVNNLRRHVENCVVEGADYKISLENKDRKETRSDGDSKLYESGGEKEGGRLKVRSNPKTSETLDAWREDDVWIWSKKGQREEGNKVILILIL